MRYDKLIEQLISRGVPHTEAIKATEGPLSQMEQSVKTWLGLDCLGDEVKEMAKQEAILREKGKRFSISARVLTGEEITCHVINDKGTHPASYDLGTKKLMLNEAHPATKNPIAALIYDRGKLFHEISHAKWTTSEERMRLYPLVNNGQAFLDMSNFLEDGRIERVCKETYQGSGYYLDAILEGIIKQGNMDKGPTGALPIYVRTKKWRNKADEKFWAPYKERIDRAIACDSTDEVCRISAEIVNELYPKKANEPQSNPNPNPDNKGEGEGKKGSGAGSGSGNDEDKAQAQDGSGAEEEKREGEFNTEVLEAIKEQIKNAMERCEAEAEAEQADILEAVANEQFAQEFADAAEETVADELASMLVSLLVENNRSKFTRSKEGILNTLSLPNALTNRRCFHVKEETLGLPHVALLLDVSGSMSSSADALTKAGRILNGALQKVGIATKVISFNNYATIEPVVPVGRDLFTSGGTMMGNAYKLANNWLEAEQAERGLIVAVTDGHSAHPQQIREEKARCENSRGYIIGVVVGDMARCWPKLDAENKAKFTDGFHETAIVPNVSNLPAELEPKLLEFIAGN